MPHRYFIEDLKADDTACSVYLTGDEAYHLAVVMRAKRGERVTLCEGKGSDFDCVVENADKDSVFLTINSIYKSVSEPSIRVILYVGYPKQDKLEMIIQKATELGACEIVPFFSRYCVAAPKNEDKKNERYNRIALEAAKQSGRGVIPRVQMPLTYDEMLKAAAQSDAAFFCYEAQKGESPLHSQLTDGVKTVAIVTGSEGGFSPDEAQKAADNGLLLTGLGARILRCETAPLAALAAVMTLTGNLQ